jgi:glycosyltransferase involved in cell wall biosynthesis
MPDNDSITTPSVVHITFSTHGGAGKVAQRLVALQSSFGMKSSLLTATDGKLPSLLLSDPSLVARGLLDFYLVRRTQNSHLFSLLRNTEQKLDSSILDERPEVIHLHWTPGMIGPEGIRALVNSGKKVVWTTHDMWPMTGGCHHALGCEKYQSSCEHCPQTREFFQSKVSNEYKRRQQAIDHGRGIEIIAPSKWMSDKLKKSSMFTNANVSVIPNYLDTAHFSPRDKAVSRRVFNISEDEFVIGCAAADLADPMKGISNVMDVVRKLRDSCPETNFRLLLVGGGNKAESDQLFKTTGLLNDSSMVDAYNSMDVFVSASLAESFSYTLAEAASVGIPRVCLNESSMPEMIEPGITGLIANSLDEMVLALIRLARDRNLVYQMGRNSRAMATQRFSGEVVHQAHMAVYANHQRGTK